MNVMQKQLTDRLHKRITVLCNGDGISEKQEDELIKILDETQTRCYTSEEYRRVGDIEQDKRSKQIN
jgi:hypothetical protein